MTRKRAAVLMAPLIVLGLIGANSWITQDVRASSCPPPSAPHEASERADYVFAGEVVDIRSAATRADELVPGDQQGGLDLRVLFGGVGLFLAIVVAITLLRRWR